MELRSLSANDSRRYFAFALAGLCMAFLLLTRPVDAQRPGAPGLGDSLFPQLGNGGYDVQHYSIDLRFSPERNHISATATISAIATQALSRFNLDLQGMQVHSVAINGARAHFERRDAELIITPPQPLAADQPFTAAVIYEGVPQPITDPSVPFIDLGWQRWNDDFYAAASQPSGSMNWFPCNNHPADKASFSLRITVPQPLTAASNGILAQVVDHDDGTRTFHWQMDDPMATYLAMVAVGDFVVARDDSGPVPIRNYFPAGLDPEIAAGYDITREMMDWLSEMLGPYPFAAYGVVALPGFPAALETQTLSLFGAEQPEEIVIMHELAHQWFGNSVTLADWRDIWLHEGIATYFMTLWLGRSMSAEVFTDFVQGVSDFLDQGPPPGDPDRTQLFGPAVYFGGAKVLHELRLEVGDDVFFAILRAFHQDNAYGSVRTRDFIDLAERLSQMQLEGFFDFWLYGGPAPAES